MNGDRSRSTKQRIAIWGALDGAGGFRTAQELYDELRRRGARVGLTTVYRTLQSLADDGDVDVLRNDAGEAMYRRCATADHHHHLVCRSCGTSVELTSDEVERWARSAARRHGFSDVTHTTELYGLCEACVSA
jgi:Fur family ferric uptake transcriptional regulator